MPFYYLEADKVTLVTLGNEYNENRIKVNPDNGPNRRLKTNSLPQPGKQMERRGIPTNLINSQTECLKVNTSKDQRVSQVS